MLDNRGNWIKYSRQTVFRPIQPMNIPKRNIKPRVSFNLFCTLIIDNEFFKEV